MTPDAPGPAAAAVAAAPTPVAPRAEAIGAEATGAATDGGAPAVDAALAVAREVVVATQVCTLRHVMTCLRDYSDGATAAGALDLPVEAVRRIVRQLEADGVVVPRVGGRYDIAPAFKAAPRAIAMAALAPAAALPPVPAANAGVLQARAVVEVALHAARQRATAGAGKLAPAVYITSAALAAMLDTDDATARLMMDSVADAGVVAPKPSPGRGFPVVALTDATPAASLRAAIARLVDQAAYTPSLAAQVSALLPHVAPAAAAATVPTAVPTAAPTTAPTTAPTAAPTAAAAPTHAPAPAPAPTAAPATAGVKRHHVDGGGGGGSAAKRPTRGVRFADESHETDGGGVPAVAAACAVTPPPALRSRVAAAAHTSVGWGAGGGSLWRVPPLH